MTENALKRFIETTHRDWGPLSSELVAAVAAQLQALLAAPASEPWLARLHAERPPSRELHRDADHGFVLLAHAEPEGLYRPPHDHGRSWVIYAVQDGEIEMGTYARIGDQLVKRGASVIRAGEVQVYLPGDIHDTRCLRSALLYRFTERDLRIEDRQGRLTRYDVRDGGATAGRG